MLSKNIVPFLMILIQFGPSFAHYAENNSSVSPATQNKKVRKCVRKAKIAMSTPAEGPKATPAPEFSQVPKDNSQQVPPTNTDSSNEGSVEAPESEEKPREGPKPEENNVENKPEENNVENKPEEKPQPAPQSPPPSSGRPMDPRYVPSDVMREMNEIRARNGKPPLQYNDKLEQNAYSQAQYQSSIKTMTHDRPGGVKISDQLASNGFKISNLGETAAAGVYTSHDAVNAWEGSPDHFEIMTGDYKLMGTAMIDGYATTVFATEA